MSAATTVLTGGDVAVGDRLPELRLPITPRTVVMGASATRDWQPQHHDHKHCVEVAGVPDIFLNTPHQAGLIQRYLTDWAGPRARLGRLSFRMRRSIIPGNELVFGAEITGVEPDGPVTWVDLDVHLQVEGEDATASKARVALPSTSADNPWELTGDAWTP